ncbi:hypothetical protein [Pantoea sp.]
MALNSALTMMIHFLKIKQEKQRRLRGFLKKQQAAKKYDKTKG